MISPIVDDLTLVLGPSAKFIKKNAIGGRPLLIEDASVYLLGVSLHPKPLWRGSCYIMETHKAITRIAGRHGVNLIVWDNDISKVVWASYTPDIWLGKTTKIMEMLHEVLPTQMEDAYMLYRAMLEDEREKALNKELPSRRQYNLDQPKKKTKHTKKKRKKRKQVRK